MSSGLALVGSPLWIDFGVWFMMVRACGGPGHALNEVGFDCTIVLSRTRCLGWMWIRSRLWHGWVAAQSLTFVLIGTPVQSPPYLPFSLWSDLFKVKRPWVSKLTVTCGNYSHQGYCCYYHLNFVAIMDLRRN